MKNILKNLNIGGLLALVAGVVLTVSWGTFEKATPRAVTGWYEVQQQGSQLVVTGEPSETNCNENSGQLCAMHLAFEEGDVTFPISVQDAETSPDIEVIARSYRN